MKLRGDNFLIFTCFYTPSKNYLISLIYDKKVYLDLDPNKDPYDRYVALTYVRHNSTHLLNVNKKMIDSGHAVI